MQGSQASLGCTVIPTTKDLRYGYGGLPVESPSFPASLRLSRVSLRSHASRLLDFVGHQELELVADALERSAASSRAR